MAFSLIFYNLSNIWPFSANKIDDIEASNHLVNKLPIPEHTKQFVYAVQEPETGALIYILCVQSLSERSAVDALCLIKAVKPDAVIAQLPYREVPELYTEGLEDDAVPTNVMEVVKKSFVDILDKEAYDEKAADLVLKEIFGVGFAGHLFAAKNAAKEIGCSFLVVDSHCFNVLGVKNNSQIKSVARNISPVNQNVVSAGFKSFHGFCSLNESQLQMLRLMFTSMDDSLFRLNSGVSDPIQPESDYMPPQFAKSIYPLFSQLHNLFGESPSAGTGLANVQKIFNAVNGGERIDTKDLSDVFTFRIMLELVRTVLNRAGRLPLNKLKGYNTHGPEFLKLSADEKSHVVLSQALRYQCGKFKSIVAVIDSTCLGGIRKHWNTSLPNDVKDMFGEFVTSCEDSDHSGKKPPLLAIGVGATAVMRASSLTKVIPTSSFIKLLTFKLPEASLKLMTAKTHNVFRPLTPGLVLAGTKSVSKLKAFAISAIARGVIASAETTSFSAMRASFYQIMRTRASAVRIRPIGLFPWVTLSFSVATFAALVMYSEELECAAEMIPEASSVARLGRGIERLRNAARRTERPDLEKCVEAMMWKLKMKFK